MELTQIANYLESNGLGIQGQTLFINTMPAECKMGALLRSPLNGTPVNWEIPGYFKTEFSVVVRGHRYEAAKDLMKSITDVLTMFETQVDDIFFKFIRPAHLPVAFRVSDGNFIEVMVKFNVAYCQ